MSTPAITAEGLSKRYRIGAAAARPRTLKEALTKGLTAPRRNWQRVRRLSTFGDDDELDVIWALRDVSFQLEHGEVLGLIGRNGAGKSTLLKILSRITHPTMGRARIAGRVGSLLEVGTGFHPELTGRDNVYLNGSILGMNRADIASRFDEIVDFAGVSQFIDTPVKRYSSGMYLRLAFAVAAHLEPDVLIVDEVLAVGDAEFQRRCLSKMDDVARGGRTVLFVSHNMNAIQRLCTRCLLLDGGRLVAAGPTRQIVADYLAAGMQQDAEPTPAAWIDVSRCTRSGTGAVRVDAVRYASDDPSINHCPYPGGPLELALALDSDGVHRVDSLAVTLYDQHGTKLVNLDTISQGRTIRLIEGRTLVPLRIKALHLRAGTYVLGLWLADARGKTVYDHVESAFRLEVIDLQDPSLGATAPGLVECDFEIGEVEMVASTSSPAPSARAAAGRMP